MARTSRQDVQKISIERLLAFSNSQKYFCLLNSNDFVLNDKLQLNKYDFLAGWGCVDEAVCESNAIQKLNLFIQENSGKWVFGFISYDFKNEIEKLSSSNSDNIQMPLLHFFVPEFVLLKQNKEQIIICQGKQKVSEEKIIENILNHKEKKIQSPSFHLYQKITKTKYLDTVEKIKQHIQFGDVYELTYCQEFFADKVIVWPANVYASLNMISPSPMSCYYKLGDKYLVSSSPERFLRKKGQRLYSQPVKGTAPRGKNTREDERMKLQLFNDEKERAENVMIVDLVRNDLSKVSKRGSVKVEELFGTYSFSTVHQMISTISCELKSEIDFTDIIKATFPMGSMTGAPKVRAMQLIEEYEATKRGLFSGTVGYISPAGDFDFSVIIRSLLYNAANRCLSLMVGSAITAKSDPVSEYNECLLKADAAIEALNNLKSKSNKAK
ncbi:MAG: anthranilate synthase component I family protein [Bacteroidia bacterium]